MHEGSRVSLCTQPRRPDASHLPRRTGECVPRLTSTVRSVLANACLGRRLALCFRSSRICLSVRLAITMPRAGPAITFVEPLVLYTRLLRAPPAVIRSAHDGALPSFRTSLKGRCIPQATHCWNGPLGRLSSESGACQLKPSAIWAWPHIVGCGQHTAPGAAAAAGAWNAHGLARRPSPMASVARREFVTRSRDKNTDALRCERRQKVRNPVSNQV